MRKILILLTTLLSGSLAFAQEAESTTGNELEVRIIPRFELNPYAPVKGNGWSMDRGTTSLYTQLEGSIGDHVSYFFSNHWLSTDPASLYVIDEDGEKSANLFRNDNLNWLDMGYVNLNFGSWDFTLGKDMVVIGSYEEDAYDYDSHANLNSYFWNAAQVYQWGAKVAWTTPDESHQLVAQVMSSPFSCRPFGASWFGKEEGHLKTFSLGWYGDFDWFAPIWSVNMMEYAKGRYIKMLGLGNQFYAGDFTFTLDWINRFEAVDGAFLSDETTLAGSAMLNINDKWEIFAKAGWDNAPGKDYFCYADSFDDDSFVPSWLTLFVVDANMNLERRHRTYKYGGLGVHWYPLADSQDLRVHAVAAYNNLAECVSLNVGVTYNFSLTNLLRK